MSDPKQEQQRTPDELDLEPETVKDLDVDDTDAENVIGGSHSTLMASTANQG